MKLTRMAAAIGTVAALLCSHAHAADYLDGVKKNYGEILISKIIAGKAVETNYGRTCFYSYNAKVADRIKGSQGKMLQFLSEAKLTIGQEYLIFYNSKDAELHRFGMADERDRDTIACEKLISGKLLLWNEINAVRQSWNGQELIDAVEFEDPQVRNVKIEVISDVHNLIKLKYVKNRLTDQ